MAIKETKTSTKKATSKSTSKTAKTSKSVSGKKATDKKKAAPVAAPQLKLIRNDEWLAPFSAAIEGRHQHALDKINELTQGGKQKLADFATGYLYYGLHFEDKKWILREWAPNATEIYVVGDFNNWQEDKAYAMRRLPKTSGDW
jgi:1,4-alpha-glucan branching enzyme